MDTRKLEKFAQSARRSLHEQVGARLTRVLTTDSAELRAKAKTIEALKARVKAQGRDAVIEQVAYTWFNRFCALRYMDVNAYTRVGTVSPVTSPAGEAFTQPEILQEAKLGHVDGDFASFVDADTVFGLLNGRQPSADPQQEAYRLLLVAVCNSYHDTMPFMFQPIDDYTELLMPDDLLSAGSILQAVREALTPDACRDVEVIGWLYQFYISEKKDAVMARQGAVPPEDIPAVTQLFTPHWIVRYMVENSLGRLWMLNHPDSRLTERMDYYIPPPEGEVDSDQWTVDSGGRVDSGQGRQNASTVDRPEGESRTGEPSPSTDHSPLSTSSSLSTVHYPLITSPEAIRLCDPACGSGHILTYAFDLLYAIYEEQGYNPVEIPRLILEKNLTGIEIDERAGALAGFALMMKARARDRRFLRRDVLPNIVVMEDVVFTPQELDAYIDAVGRDLFTQDMRDWLQQFEQATVFGSLIRPLVGDTAFIRTKLNRARAFDNLFLSHTNDKLRTALGMTEALNQHYHIVVANPPYMGSRNMAVCLRDYAKDYFPDSKSDMYAMFVERALEMSVAEGFLGLMTPFTWMFLTSYVSFRSKIVNDTTLLSLVRPEYHAFFESAFVPICTFCLRNAPSRDSVATFIDLAQFSGAEKQAPQTLYAINNPDCEWRYHVNPQEFNLIPDVLLAYWVSDRVRRAFTDSTLLGEVANPKKGLTTGRNELFIRLWYEVSLDKQKTPRAKWFPVTKGGPYRKWYGNNEYVIDWENDGERLKAFPGSVIRNEQSYFEEGGSWNDVSMSNFSMRYTPPGFINNAVGPILYSDNLYEHIGALNSSVSTLLFQVLSPTMKFEVGAVAKFPYRQASAYSEELVSELIGIHLNDWNAYETSWDFGRPPLLDGDSEDFGVTKSQRTTESSGILKPLSLGLIGSGLPDRYMKIRLYWHSLVVHVRGLETKNNRVFIEAYGLHRELRPELPMNEVTLTCNPEYRYGNGNLNTRNWGVLCERFPSVCQQISAIARETAPNRPEEDRLGLEQRLLDDTMREFISYAVGCMFGRYSLDKPGLILANQGETINDYVRKVTGAASLSTSDFGRATSDLTFMPDEDNVIPILDGEWFADDITERFKAFLRVTFGSEHYEENLAFIEAAIGRDIRGYFLREFYDDHVKTYQKRPIYWLFSSPNGSFNALIYMHRYQSDTVSIVLNDYLREYASKLTARKRHLEQVGIRATASPRDKAQATKEVEQIDKILAELRAYEDEVLYPLAMRQVEIDLDDGVAVNYPKFGRALAVVKGLS